MNVDPQKIQAMINILQSMLVEDTPEVSQQEIKQQQETQIDNTFVNISSNKNSSRINKFDNMIEKNMHKQDVMIDKKLNIHPPVTRSRHYVPLEVKCRVCGKTETINPQLSTSSEIERYKCNKCSIFPG